MSLNVSAAAVEEHLADLRALGRIEFEGDETAGFEFLGCVIEDQSDDIEPIGAGVECLRRFMITNFGCQ